MSIADFCSFIENSDARNMQKYSKFSFSKLFLEKCKFAHKWNIENREWSQFIGLIHKLKTSDVTSLPRLKITGKQDHKYDIPLVSEFPSRQ